MDKTYDDAKEVIIKIFRIPALIVAAGFLIFVLSVVITKCNESEALNYPKILVEYEYHGGELKTQEIDFSGHKYIDYSIDGNDIILHFEEKTDD